MRITSPAFLAGLRLSRALSTANSLITRRTLSSSLGLLASKAKVYAVKVGRVPGVYSTWAEAEEQVKGYPGAIFQGYGSHLRSAAEAYVAGMEELGPVSSPPELVAFADAGSRDGIAGIGIANVSERLPAFVQDSARAELYAILRVLETDPDPGRHLSIYTDSSYARLVFSELSSAPFRAGKGPDALWTRALIELVVHLLRRRPSSYQFHQAVAHSREYGNEVADQLASQAIGLPYAVPARDFIKEVARLKQVRKPRKRIGYPNTKL